MCKNYSLKGTLLLTLLLSPGNCLQGQPSAFIEAIAASAHGQIAGTAPYGQCLVINETGFLHGIDIIVSEWSGSTLKILDCDGHVPGGTVLASIDLPETIFGPTQIISVDLTDSGLLVQSGQILGLVVTGRKGIAVAFADITGLPNGSTAYRAPDGNSLPTIPISTHGGAEVLFDTQELAVASPQMTIDSGNLILSIHADMTFNYQLQTSQNLLFWVNTVDPAFQGTGDVVSFTLLAPTGLESDFYRFGISLAP